MNLHAYILSLVAVTFSLPLVAQDAPTVPVEMKSLERLVGTWKVTEFVSEVAEWTPREYRQSGDVTSAKWILDGWYLEERTLQSSDGSKQLGVWHYDEDTKKFNYAVFQAPFANRVDFTYKWDEKADAFIGTCAMQDGVTMHTVIHFPEKDTRVWRAVATDAKGKIYLNMTSSATRVVVVRD